MARTWRAGARQRPAPRHSVGHAAPANAGAWGGAVCVCVGVAAAACFVCGGGGVVQRVEAQLRLCALEARCLGRRGACGELPGSLQAHSKQVIAGVQRIARVALYRLDNLFSVVAQLCARKQKRKGGQGRGRERECVCVCVCVVSCQPKKNDSASGSSTYRNHKVKDFSVRVWLPACGARVGGNGAVTCSAQQQQRMQVSTRTGARYKHTHKHTQAHKHTATQAHSHTRTQVHKNIHTQRYIHNTHSAKRKT